MKRERPISSEAVWPGPLTVVTQAIDPQAGDTGPAVRVILRGEADVSNHHQLHAALSSIELDGVKTVYLQLAELAFCDVCAFRHLVSFADDAQSSGHAISTHGAGTVIRTMTAAFHAQDALKLA